MGTKKRAPMVEIKNADGSPGGRLSKDKYDATRKVLLKVIPRSKKGIPYNELRMAVQNGIPKELLPASGSGGWLATTVKLDLEGRGLIERIPEESPQRLRRVR